MNLITVDLEDAETGISTQFICGVDGAEYSFAITNRETDIETCFDSATAHALTKALADGASSSSFEFRNLDGDSRGRIQITRSGAVTRLSVKVLSGWDPRAMTVTVDQGAVRRLRDALARQLGSDD